MKFLCGSCRTKYQISDEKVRGKILTIRCKKCGAKIIVRESLARESGEGSTVVAPVAEAPRSTPMGVAMEGALSQAFNQAMAGGSTDDVPVETQSERPPSAYEWYTAIDGHQAGPFTFDQLRDQLASGALLGRHYAWHEGMEHWRRIRDVEALKTLAERPAPPPPPPGPDAHPVDLDRTTADPHPAPLSGLAASELPTAATPATLFADTTPALGSGASQPVQLGGEASGRPAAGSEDGLPSLEEGAEEDLFANVPRATPQELVRKESTRFFVNAAGVRGIRSWNRLGLVLGAVVVLLLGGLGAGVATGVVDINLPGIGNPFEGSSREAELYSGDADDPASVALLKEQERKAKARSSARRTRRPSAGATRSDPEGWEGPDGEYITEDDDGLGGPRGSRGGDGASISLDGIGSKDPVTGVSVGNVALPTADVDIPVVDERRLSEQAIAKTIASGRRSVKFCYETVLKGQRGVGGKLDILVTVAPSGRVTQTEIETAKFRGSALAECISDKIRDWRFPKFEGEPETISIPFILQQSSY
jgi:predicted Zn finger-like uncharacterized protein